MNNNNLFNTNTFIGTTHQDYFKVSSNALLTQIAITSNILEQHLNYTSNILEQHLNYTSNILDIRASNFTTTTSNLILARYDPMIEKRYELTSLPFPIPGSYPTSNIYISNSNYLGEIRFWNSSSSNFYTPGIPFPIEAPDYLVKIDLDGKLKTYYTYDPLLNATYGSGWVDVVDSIVGLNADSVNQGTLITTIEIQLTADIANLQAQISQLVIIFMEEGIITDEQQSIIESELQQIAVGETLGVSRTSMDYLFYLFWQYSKDFATYRLQKVADLIALKIAQNPATAFFLGVGTAAFGFIYALQDSMRHNQFLASTVKSQITSNSFLTLGEKRILYSCNVDHMNSNLIDQLEYTSNITALQGFLNTHITTEQFIPNFKCDNLYLNNGNISGINYVNVNNIVADGKIKENNKFLDTTYLTSNHIYNLAYNYTAERQYPPKLYNSSSIEETVSLLNKQVYRQILFLNTTSIVYGSGFYEVFSSSTFDNGITTKNRLFNFNTSETTTSPRWAISLYNSGSGNYQGDNSIVSGYFGDWVIIKMPQQILLTRYRIYQRSDFLTKAPSLWKVYGSNDGITFTEITEASQTTRLSSYTSGFYEKTLASTFTTQYQYFGFVFSSLLSVSGATDLSFSELQLFGKEIISNSIVSNIYTTSNICKNLIIYDTPEVCKHFSFYILITTPIVIGSTTYYKYDINLSQYTKKGYIQIGSGSNDPYRIFKIRAFYASSYFGTLVGGLPDVIYADIFMSFKAAASALGQAGLNVCSIGNISNPSLTAVPPNNLFFMRNGANSIDYITVVSKSVADVRVVIEDLLG